jgi:hypothetical protein
VTKLFVSIFIIWIFSNSTDKMAKSSIRYEQVSYEVYKIDSVHSYYLIFAKRDDSLFKIVSKKDSSLAYRKIQAGQKYNLTLNSLWNQDIWIGNTNVKPSLTPNVTCLGFDDSTSICIDREHAIYDLFVTPSLKGLCYTGANK